MNGTVFVTVLSGVLTYVFGQIVVKLVIDPVQETKKTIGTIAHTLVERANVISNPGLPSAEIMNETSKELRKLSSQLESHLYLVPSYDQTSRVFGLPTKEELLKASRFLIGLSNSVHGPSTDGIYKANAQRVEGIRDALGIYMSKDERWPKDLE